MVIDSISYLSGSVIIEIGKCNFVLSSDWMSNNDLADIIELIPILIEVTQIPVQWLELRSSRNGNIQGLTGKKRFQVKQVVIVLVHDV